MNGRGCDVAVIGAGAAGMAAVRVIAGRGYACALIDREGSMGGILPQCIHNGFGLHRFGEELTGPEFSLRLERGVRETGTVFLPDTTVLSIERAIEALAPGEPANGFPAPSSAGEPDRASGFRLILSSARDGIVALSARAVVLATGSRERNRGNVRIAGDRPAGVFTAGLAQRLMNIEGYLPGKRAVIIGSGDIGLIMARRLVLSGARVEAVVEILGYPSGLARNVAQCLDDFSIPLYLAHATLAIHGKDRVCGVDIAPLAGGAPRLEGAFGITCDTVLLSVGLVPENELAEKAGVRLNPVTNGAIVDSRLMTSVPGIFACGNALHIHDLVDRVAEEAERSGSYCADWLDTGGSGESPAFGQGSLPEAERREIPLRPGENVRYTVPSSIDPAGPNRVLLRSLVPMERGTLAVMRAGSVVAQRKVSWVRPGEMIQADFAAGEIARAGGEPDLASPGGDGHLEIALLPAKDDGI